MDVGYNVRLSPAEVAEALRDAAIRKLGKKGRALDLPDIRAFHTDAAVFVKTMGSAATGTGAIPVDAIVAEVTVTWAE